MASASPSFFRGAIIEAFVYDDVVSDSLIAGREGEEVGVGVLEREGVQVELVR